MKAPVNPKNIRTWLAKQDQSDSYLWFTAGWIMKAFFTEECNFDIANLQVKICKGSYIWTEERKDMIWLVEHYCTGIAEVMGPGGLIYERAGMFVAYFVLNP